MAKTPAERVRALTGDFGVQCVLECVGHRASAAHRGWPARAAPWGRVGVPHYEAIPTSEEMSYNNISVGGAPLRSAPYIKALLPDVLGGKIEPGRVFDRIIGLDEVPDSYRAMNERRAIKVMVKP